MESKSMSRSQSKYYNTALCIDEALMLLLDKKEFEYITVKEIWTKAGVNRSTFYLHYETVEDLLKECLEHVNKEFINQFSENNKVDVKSDSLEDLILINDKYLIPYLTFVKEHKSFYKAISKNPSTLDAESSLNHLFMSVIEPILLRFGSNKDDIPYLFEYYIKGTSAIIIKWANGGFKEDINHMSDLIKSCIKPYIIKDENETNWDLQIKIK